MDRNLHVLEGATPQQEALYSASVQLLDASLYESFPLSDSSGLATNFFSRRVPYFVCDPFLHNPVSCQEYGLHRCLVLL